MVPGNQAQEALTNLTLLEEKELLPRITILTQRGYVPRYKTVRKLAEVLVLGVNGDDIQLVRYNAFGKDWVACFISSHPQPESARRKLIKAARIKDISVERLTMVREFAERYQRY